MTDILLPVLTFVAAYMVGGIPFGYLVARWKGVDIFAQGSGNIGATNVGRVLGRRFGVLVFVLDFAKGAVPVALARAAGSGRESYLPAETLAVVAGLGAVLGHLFPVYLRFRGGKGVATAAGVVVLLVPAAAALALAAWVGVVCATRYVSAGSLAAAATLVVARLLSVRAPFAGENVAATLFCLVVAALVTVRHRANVARLLRGGENRLQENTTMHSMARVVHVLSLGLWFGMAAFFSLVVALSLFSNFERLGENPSRPAWFPLAEPYTAETEEFKGPKEQGQRVAGAAVSPLFDWYFLLQGVCGFLALATAWGWQYRYAVQKVHERRVTVLLAALATVIIGWPLEWHVSRLRPERNAAVEAYLRSPNDIALREAAVEARARFGAWHMASLFLNFVTLGLVTAGMAMAAYLPPWQGAAAGPSPGREGEPTAAGEVRGAPDRGGQGEAAPLADSHAPPQPPG